MSHDAFLEIITQLAGRRKARVVIQGSVIFIETESKSSKWSLSTQLFASEGYLPPSIKEWMSNSGLMKWQERGAYLQLDPVDQSVHLVHEIHSCAKYVPFKYMMNDFVSVANEWREILEEFADKDHVSLRLDLDRRD